MSIEQVTPQSEIERMIEEKSQRYFYNLIEALKLAGETAVANARITHAYQDQTGNLTSSIGYRIINNGKVVVQSSFDVVKGGKEGAEKGKELLDELTRKNRKGLVFMMVAGMNYASYVEAMGLGAFDASAEDAKRVIDRAVKHLKL